MVTGLISVMTVSMSILFWETRKTDEPKLFENFSLGVVSNRDAWVYNFCKQSMTANMSGMIEFYGSELDRFNAEYQV